MGTFIYSTQAELDGPWLVDRPALKELGEIVETIAQKFESANQDFIEAKVDKVFGTHQGGDDRDKKDSYLRELQQKFPVKKAVSLALSRSKFVKEESIDRLLSSPDLLDEAPIGLRIRIESAERQANVVFREAELNIDTSPQTDELAREAFVTLQQWASANQAPLWQRIWKKRYMLFVIGWMFVSLILGSIFANTDVMTKNSIKPAADQLLQNGITDKDVPKAVEILLRLELKEPIAESKKEEIPLWVKVFVLGGLVSLALLSVRPPQLIGIGRNVQRIDRWRKWIHFLSITIPGFILVSVAWPYASTVLGIPH